MDNSELSIITCTAWEAVGEYNQLIDTTHGLRLKGGHTLYYFAETTRMDNVQLQRIADGELRVIRRYIPFDAIVELVPIESGS